MADLVTRIERGHAELDLLVNNAGYVELDEIVDLEPDVLDRHIAIKLIAPMQLTRYPTINTTP